MKFDNQVDELGIDSACRHRESLKISGWLDFEEAGEKASGYLLVAPRQKLSGACQDLSRAWREGVVTLKLPQAYSYSYTRQIDSFNNTIITLSQ